MIVVHLRAPEGKKSYRRGVADGWRIEQGILTVYRKSLGHLEADTIVAQFGPGVWAWAEDTVAAAPPPALEDFAAGQEETAS